MYCQIRNDEKLIFDCLPFRVTLVDGNTRTSLSELSASQLAAIGVYPVVGNQPEHDPNTQRLVGPMLTLDGDHVTATWTVEGLSTEEIASILSDAKAAKRAEIAAARYAAEIAGVTVSGVTVRTDRESQALITGAALKATQDAEYTCTWKAESGFVSLNAATIIAVADAVRAHVQACFDAEAAKCVLIDAAATVAEVDAVEW
jgi:hypothetical protein